MAGLEGGKGVVGRWMGKRRDREPVVWESALFHMLCGLSGDGSEVGGIGAGWDLGRGLCLTYYVEFLPPTGRRMGGITAYQRHSSAQNPLRVLLPLESLNRVRVRGRGDREERRPGATT